MIESNETSCLQMCDVVIILLLAYYYLIFFHRNPRGKTLKEKNAARSSPPSYAQR